MGEGGGRMTNGFVTHPPRRTIAKFSLHPHTLSVSSLNTNFKEKVKEEKMFFDTVLKITP